MINLRKSDVEHVVQVPIFRIKFPLDTCVYQKNNNEFERIQNTYVKRNTFHEVVQVFDEDYYRLKTGEIVKTESNNIPTIYHGSIVVLNNDVKVYSLNGFYLRKLSEGQKITVKDIGHTLNNKRYFKINNKEIVYEQQSVKFVKGFYQPNKPETINYQGKPLILQNKTGYPFDKVEGSMIRLTDFNDMWIDVSYHPGTIKLL